MSSRFRSGLVVALVVALVALAAACGVVRRAAHAVAPQPDPPTATRWNATLWQPSDTLPDRGDTTGPHGIAWMAPGSADNHTIRVRIAMHRGDPSEKYVWRIHFGKCDNDQGVFGPPAAYRDLVTDTTGVASAYALFALGFPSSGQYFVRVDRVAGADPETFICGNLAPPK